MNGGLMNKGTNKKRVTQAFEYFTKDGHHPRVVVDVVRGRERHTYNARPGLWQQMKAGLDYQVGSHGWYVRKGWSDDAVPV
jgi:hypothetical protein